MLFEPDYSSSNAKICLLCPFFYIGYPFYTKILSKYKWLKWESVNLYTRHFRIYAKIIQNGTFRLHFVACWFLYGFIFIHFWLSFVINYIFPALWWQMMKSVVQQENTRRNKYSRANAEGQREKNWAIKSTSTQRDIKTILSLFKIFMSEVIFLFVGFLFWIVSIGSWIWIWLA